VSSNERSDDCGYRLVVVELDDVAQRVRADRPNLFVGITTRAPEVLVEGLRRGKYRPAWARNRVVCLRSDLCSQALMGRDEAGVEKPKLIRLLRSKGYTVNGNTTAYRTYVVNLYDPDLDGPGKGYVYVGQTSKDPEQRLHEHLTGALSKKGVPLSSRVVKKFGRDLNHELMTERIYPTKKAALKAERRLAERLRQQGYVVEGGH
jgi:predicted GIY-YIG superfamily endonuclease